MKKKDKIIIGIIIAIIVVALIAWIFSAIYFYRTLGNGIDYISDKIESYKEKEQIREDIYNSIPEELLNRNLISQNLKYVDYEYGWSYEWADKTDKYYFYIDSDNYEKYKNYWLEGIDESQYRDKYNSDLYTYGDYVFKAININDLSYESDVEYENVHLTANKIYYLVQIYDEAIYYKYVTAEDVNDEIKYHVYKASNCKEDSISKEYIFYQENDKWEIEELIR